MKRIILINLFIISCFVAHSQNNWVYIKGDANMGKDMFGTQGVSSSTNAVGYRYGASSWSLNGKLYLFGGNTGGVGDYGDVWVYDTLANTWTWIKGAKTISEPVVYGTIGVHANSNTPGARRRSQTWVLNNKLYLFGGDNYQGDMWVFDPVTNNWAWLGGNATSTYGIYGTQGMASATNHPGGRIGAVTWTYNNKLYMFGGYGNDSSRTDLLNDVWEFDPITRIWVWKKGSRTVNSLGTYGTKGVSNASNNPRALYLPTSWAYNNKLYIYGGNLNFIGSSLSEMMEYDMATNNWTWTTGSNTLSGAINYGTLGVGTSTTSPGSRSQGLGWVHNGKLYLYGGERYYQSIPSNRRADLWEFNLSTNTWTWVGGDTMINVAPVYGIYRKTNANNAPGARCSSLVWEAGSKKYVMTGGVISTGGRSNDLWEFNADTKQWSWINGSYNANAGNYYSIQGIPNYLNIPSARNSCLFWQIGDTVYVYGSASKDVVWRYDILNNDWSYVKGFIADTAIHGTLSVASILNTPGNRHNAVTWVHNRKLYLFGGNGPAGQWRNDIFEFDPATTMWRWIKGSALDTGKTGIYGVRGIASVNNRPGGRYQSAHWYLNGKLYLFGGTGYDKTNNVGDLNDLWEYDHSTNNWRWLKGADLRNQYAIMGNKGIASSTNTPGGSYESVSWTNSNKLYLFGGSGNSTYIEGDGYLNTLWEYDLSTNNWKWVSGDSATDRGAVMGTMGVPSVTNYPGSRMGSILWQYNNKVYMYGGSGYITTPGGGQLGDLWMYDFTTSYWTWVSGTNQYDKTGTYTIMGESNSSNFPGHSRSGAATWVSNNRLYLFGGYTSSCNSEVLYSGESHNDIWYYEACPNINACYPSNPNVKLNAGELCGNRNVVLNAGNIGSKYLWNTGDTTQLLEVSTPGKYWATVTNPANLKGSDTVVIATGIGPTRTLGNDTAICEGEQIVLNAGNIGASYYWNTHDTQQVIVLKNLVGYTTPVYSVRILKPNGCWDLQSIKINVNPSVPKPKGVSNSPLCINDTLTLSLTTPTNGNTGWYRNGTFIGGVISDVKLYGITTRDSGMYILVDSNVYGCVAYDTVNVHVNPTVPSSVNISVYPGTNVGPWTLVTFTANTTNSGNNPKYQWKLNGVDIPGATSFELKAVTGVDINTSDILCVEMIPDTPCAVSPIISDCTSPVLVNLSVSKNREKNLPSVYPNPTKGDLIISGLESAMQISVSNIYGQELIRTNITGATQKITIEQFAVGNYLMTITLKNGERLTYNILKR